MKLLISFFIFLISFFAPTQAINAAIPVQIGSYSHPIEPIKPKAKNKGYKLKNKPIKNQKQDTDSKLVIINSILGLIFIGGAVLFSLGFSSEIILLFWLGISFEIIWLLGLLLIVSFWGSSNSGASDIPIVVAIISFIVSLVAKGILLIVLGITASIASTWVTGIIILSIGLFLSILLLANY